MKARSLFCRALCFSLFPFLALGSISIETTNLEDFTDFSVSGSSEKKSLPTFEREVRWELSKLVSKRIPEGHSLILNFSDIDMAGDIQPWRNAHHSDIRYIEDVYPPRLEFTYRLVDAENKVVDAGEEKLRELSYIMKSATSFRRNSMSFFYEIELLEDWVREKFPKNK